jgi:protocatechuate 3,4-dioxygenase beta subunit
VNCNPIPNAWLDFWQADNNGDYDNAGYTLRGHQYSDEQGRYYLETILPGLYSSRPIRHIHVKVQAPNGEMLTSQLYFPEQPVANLTVQLIPQDGFQLALFNFVLK